MLPHTHRTPLPAAVPPAARGLPGSVTRALRAMRSDFDLPKSGALKKPSGPVTAAIAVMRAADPAFDLSPDLRALRRALADRIEADLAALDALGGDPDIEQDAGEMPEGCWMKASANQDEDDEEDDHGEDDGCGEPSLGSLGGCGAASELMPQTRWSDGSASDREHDDADGPEGDDERERDESEEGEPEEPDDNCPPVFMAGGGYAPESFGRRA